MLFNSLTFAAFFIAVYLLYLTLPFKWQNRMLIVASCIFYSAWSWKFLFIMFISITTDFYASRIIDRSRSGKRRKFFLFLSIIVNLGILCFFKYFNFFTANIHNLLEMLHIAKPGLNIALQIILPVGISFYTFEAISYVVDVYRRKTKPAQSYWDYVLFVIYFPHLVAGPIMRAKDFLPQITSPRRIKLEVFCEGCRLILFGLMQKIIVADNLAKLVDPVFDSKPPYNGVQVLLSLYAFAFQLYCDFAGYSNMARGLGKCMGFEITVNFNLPYLATSMRDFWRRWHISLSTWLRDYVYIPLGGNRNGTFETYRNLFLCMTIGGLWHGAAWTFVFWGAYHGLLLIVEHVMTRFPKARLANSRERSGVFISLIRMGIVFHLWCFSLLLFRAQSLNQAVEMVKGLAYQFVFVRGIFLKPTLISLVIFVCFLAMIEIVQIQKRNNPLILRFNPLIRGVFYFACYFLIITFGVSGGKQFIYFQF